MCATCGCDQQDELLIMTPEEFEKGAKNGQHHDHGHVHAHDHSHTHDHDHSHSKEIMLETDILSKNNLLAERNRGYFDALQILALNLVSSPGSGKTSLLERTIKDLKENRKFYVIEGDQQTMNDANRIRETGAPVVQVNTGKGCHLDAHMIHHAVEKLRPETGSCVMIENVGNLVCPSLFDLGESQRVVIMSVTEGDDKPIKYPNMFETSQLCIINKMDLLPHVPFDVEKAMDYARQVNPNLEFVRLSAYTGEGMEQWYEWLSVRQQALTA